METTNETTWVGTVTCNKISVPLEMIWKPKEDITTYELALCLPYLLALRGISPNEIDASLPHFRHFIIIDHNK